MTITREVFDNLNKEYTIEEVINELGKNNGTAGSGVLYYVWKLDDGSSAYIHFSLSDGKIDRIHIINPGKPDEMIYWRHQK